MASTTTSVLTVRQKLNSAIVGVQADANKKLPRGDLASVMLAPNAAIAATGIASPASASYTQADQSALAAAVLLLIAQVNKLTGGLTDVALAVTSNEATLAQAPTDNGLFQVIATTVSGGSATGVKQIVRDPTAVLTSGQVYWDGGTGLTFYAGDLVTHCSAMYSKSDLSQQASALLPPDAL
jgi:hypothetical protein